MRTRVFALFDDDTKLLRARGLLRERHLADDERTIEIHKDRLYHSPSFLSTTAVPLALLGGFVLAHLGALAGAIVGFSGIGGLDPVVSIGIGALGGGAMGALTCALGGVGSYRPSITRAAAGLREGRSLLDFTVPSRSYLASVDEELRALGALQVTAVL